LFGLGRVERDGRRIGLRTYTCTKSDPNRRILATKRFESNPNAIFPPQRIPVAQVHVLQVLPAALVISARTVALLDQTAARGPPNFDELPAGVEHAQIHVGLGLVPRDRELDEARAQPAALVDDAVAIVVSGVEAQLRPRRCAGLLSQRSGDRTEQRSPTLSGRRRSGNRPRTRAEPSEAQQRESTVNA
jgi:hypothetical protein